MLVALVGLATTKGVQSTPSASRDDFELLGTTIRSIRRDSAAARVANPFLSWKSSSSREEDWLLVDVFSDSFELASELSNAKEAFEITGCLPAGHACSGWLKMSARSLAMEELERNPSVSISPAMMKTSTQRYQGRGKHQGPVTSTDQYQGRGEHQGSMAQLQINKIREAFPTLTGKNLKIGVMSDSFDSLGGYALDIESGDLPSDIKVLLEGPVEDSIDEGRAMMQLIHDIAPEAKLVFRSASYGMVDFALGIEELVDEGCDVIVDDIFYLQEPVYQEGIIAQYASDAVDKSGVLYFSSIGNGQIAALSSVFQPTSCEIEGFGNTQCHDVGEGNYKWRIKGEQAENFAGLFWDSPYPMYPDDIFPTDMLAIAIYDVGGGLLGIAEPTDPIMPAIPVIIPEGEFDIVVFVSQGKAPSVFKFMSFVGYFSGDFTPNASICSPHATAPSVAGVAAAWDSQRLFELLVEPYSSTVSDQLIFDRKGNRLENPKIPRQPRFTGPDGSGNSFFGRPPDPYGRENSFRFFGTSAAAPNVAALAILVLQANSKLTPQQVYKILEGTAIDMEQPGFDFTTGHGYVNGLPAVVKAKMLKHKGKKKKKKVLKDLKALKKKKVCYDYTLN